MMNKEYAVKALTRLQDRLKGIEEINRRGIDISTYEEPFINLIEESIAIIFCQHNEDLYEKILEQVQWWLYDKVEKVIFYFDKKIDVSTAEKFVSWLSNHYKDYAVTSHSH